jgi:hypothetical protein
MYGSVDINSNVYWKTVLTDEKKKNTELIKVTASAMCLDVKQMDGKKTFICKV